MLVWPATHLPLLVAHVAVKEAERRQARNRWGSLLCRHPVAQLSVVRELVGHSRDLRVASVPGPMHAFDRLIRVSVVERMPHTNKRVFVSISVSASIARTVEDAAEE